MIRRLLLLCLVLFSFACQKEKTAYTITGTADGIEDGTEIRLQELFNNRPVVLATTTVQDGMFSFTGSIENKDMHFINIDGVPGSVPFILENADIDIDLNKKQLNQSIIKGTKDNELLASYSNKLNETNSEGQRLSMAYQRAQKAGNSQVLERISASFDSLRQAQKDYELDFVANNKESLMAVKILERMMYSKEHSTTKIKELFDDLPEKLRNGPSGKSVEKSLTALLATAEGAVAPNFEAPNPEGTLLALNDITSKNKVTILDFWAAWCGPCRRENPNLVKIYDQYQDKGLGIIGVSLDGSSRQQDPKQAWIKAIEDDGLTWHQVSNLKYFDDPVARSYNIDAIPATFLLDSEGKIIGKNLRGKALENKIAELLN